MEDVGSQMASPIFIHQTLPPMARKRNLYYHQAMNLQPQPSQLSPRRDNWNPNSWNWDSTRFVAKHIDTEILRAPGNDTTSLGLRNKGPETDGDERRLELNLGGGLNSVEEIPAPHPTKRVRSGSPGGGNNYPICQVDNCKEDLSSAKDYHRRHKVCEFHSKATKAPVGNQMQRFCQQCSRFHPLSEFDEGKRSCRRRLAGHNRRRRKTQPDDDTSQILVPGDHGSCSSANMDLVALLTAFACSGAGKNDVRINASSAPDRDQLLQILGKINSFPLPMDLTSKLQNIEGLTRKNPESSMVNHQNDMNGTSPSTMDLLAALSTTLAASSPNCLAMLSQRSCRNSDSAKTNLASADRQTTGPPDKTPHELGLVGGERSCSSHQSPSQDSDYHVQDARSSLSLQLFTSSPENESRPTVASSRNYFSSDSSKSVEDRSQSSSPVMQELFPLQNSPETLRSRKTSSDRTRNAEVLGSKTSCLPLELFNVSNRVAEKSNFQSFPYQSGYTSSGSDHSPPSLNSDAQDRTGRIHFKLFGKEPNQLPSKLRSELFEWLSNCPSGMESHIRPGCVVLSVYVSMPASYWEQIEGCMVQRLNFLLQTSAFWRNARFLVNTGKQLASHKNGKVRLCKSWTTWSSPELISMSPIAIVPGQDTNLVIRGRNLTNDGIKIRCAYMGSYASMVITGATCQGTVYDEIKLNSFQIPGTSTGILGRCFIEVENGFKGNFFPLIIADSTICLELKHLEDEIQEPYSKACDDITEEQKNEGSDRPRSREDILHFLNELGWLFQMKKSSSLPEEGSKFSLIRFKFLLVFSIERDCTALVKTLLDMMVESYSDSDGLLSRESLDMVVEIQLLNRAVKRHCTKMVEMLIHYCTHVTTEASRKFVFPPNLAGPGGITPLHLAACTLGSDDMIDILTNDPQEIGLSSWNSLLDATGQSPYCYAAMRNNHYYNTLVARKLADRKNGQVSLTVKNYKELSFARLGSGLKRSCASCSTTAMKYHKRVSGSHRLFPTPIIHSMLAVATVCVCVCLFMHAFPNVRQGSHFSWQGLDYGTM